MVPETWKLPLSIEARFPKFIPRFLCKQQKQRKLFSSLRCNEITILMTRHMTENEYPCLNLMFEGFHMR